MQLYVTLGLIGIVLHAVPACQDTSLEKNKSGKQLELSTEQMAKVERDNAFTWTLFSEAAEDLPAQENALLSPLSVSMALGMTANGAVGDTQAAMFKTLQYTGYTSAFINEYYKKLMVDLPALDPEVDLDIANSIWYKEGFTVLPKFIKTNETYYQATAKALNFNDPAATAVINAWVNTQTNGKIPTIVDRISSDMRMYLINAIYFKGAWETPFEADRTRPMDFHTQDGVVQTPLMNREGSIQVKQTDAFDAIELPYGDKTYSMIALLPTEGTAPADVIAGIQKAGVGASLSTGFQARQVRLSFPKFSFDYENTLNDELEKLGMGLALSDQADFSGISTRNKMTISEVKHKTFIEVNEEGTEAAAVTSVGVSVTSLPQYLDVTFDRPFLFFIRENTSGLILFAGQVNKPAVSD